MCYQTFLSTIVDILEIPQLCHKCKSAMWWSNLQCSRTSKYPKQALICITANWIGEDGQITGYSYASKFSAGRIEYVFSLVSNDHT